MEPRNDDSETISPDRTKFGNSLAVTRWPSERRRVGLRFSIAAEYLAGVPARIQAPVYRRHQDAGHAQPVRRQDGSRGLERSIAIGNLASHWIRPIWLVVWSSPGRSSRSEGVQFESTDDEQACRKQAIELVAAYCAQLPADEPRPLAVEAAVEAPLVDPATGENLGIPLVGIMDLVLPDPDGPLIADFKTTARGGEPLEIMHEIQLSAYSYLFRHTSHEIEGGLEIRSLVKN